MIGFAPMVVIGEAGSGHPLIFTYKDGWWPAKAVNFAPIGMMEGALAWASGLRVSACMVRYPWIEQ